MNTRENWGGDNQFLPLQAGRKGSILNRKSLYNREKVRQIVLPGILLILSIVGFAVLMGFLGNKFPLAMKKAANYFIAVHFFFLCMVNIGVFFLLIFLGSHVNDWTRIVPGYSDRANEQVQRAMQKVDEILETIVKPFIQSESKWNALKSVLSRKDL